MTMNRNALVLLAMLWVNVGCAPKHLIFTTYSDLGLDIAGTDGQPTKAVFGYKRFEGAIIPVDVAAPPPGAQEPDVMSVYAAIDVENHWWRGLDVFQVIATGQAADNVASNPDPVRDLVRNRQEEKKNKDGGGSTAGKGQSK